MRRHSCIVVSTRCCSSSLEDTLHGTAIVVRPRRLRSSAAAMQASALRLEITPLAPASAMAIAMALPMPRVEPVISAPLPERSNGPFATPPPRLFLCCRRPAVDDELGARREGGFLARQKQD